MTQGMRELQNLVFDLQLTDVDIGQKFTWLRENAASRIDRILIDKELILSFPLTRAYCKGRIFSDHFSIVLSTTQVKWDPPPFRALDCQLEELSFLNIFKTEWLQMSGLSLERKLKSIKRPLKEWNRNIFGHIDRSICKFQKALNKVEEEALSREIMEDEWRRIDALRSQLWLWMIRK